MDAIEVDGALRPIHNSAGRLIHPDEEGIRNFWRWFGDSQAIDDHGRPLVLYHGSIAWERPDWQQGNIHAFDRRASVDKVGRPESIDAIGTWLSDNPGDGGASMYSGARLRPGEEVFPGVVYPLYVRMVSPWEVDYERLQDAWIDWQDSSSNSAYGRELFKRNQLWGDADFFVRGVMLDGVDGFILDKASGARSGHEFRDQRVFIVVSPMDIKSAIGNSGLFDPASRFIADRPEMAMGLAPRLLVANGEAPRCAPPAWEPHNLALVASVGNSIANNLIGDEIRLVEDERFVVTLCDEGVVDDARMCVGRYLLKSRGAIVGGMSYVIQGTKAHVSGIFVRPECRRMGFASALIERARQDFPDLAVASQMTPDGAKFFGYAVADAKPEAKHGLSF